MSNLSEISWFEEKKAKKEGVREIVLRLSSLYLVLQHEVKELWGPERILHLKTLMWIACFRKQKCQQGRKEVNDVSWHLYFHDLIFRKTSGDPRVTKISLVGRDWYVVFICQFSVRKSCLENKELVKESVIAIVLDLNSLYLEVEKKRPGIVGCW